MQVLNSVSSHGLEAVLVAGELVIEFSVLISEHVLNVPARLNAPAMPEFVQSSLQLREALDTNTSWYNSFPGSTNES